MLSLLVTLGVAIQVRAAAITHPSKTPVRVVFMGGEWSSGAWANKEASLPSRFGEHLEKFLRRKVEMRTVKVQNLENLPGEIDTLLKQSPADYVFFFCDHSGVPIIFASEQMAPWNPNGTSLSNYVGRQIGAIRLATNMRRNPLPEDVLLKPLTEILSKASASASKGGAKFVLLWSGFPISQMSWKAEIPNEWPVHLASYLDFFKTKPLVSSERLMLHFRRNNVPFVANLQISRYFSSLRLTDNAKAQTLIWSPQATENVGKMLATSVVATEF